jgi:hypothetical protein
LEVELADRRPRRHSWNRSSSDGFGPIRQVGVAYSIGFPMVIVGVLMLAVAYSEGDLLYWLIGGGLMIGGLIAAASGRVT